MSSKTKAISRKLISIIVAAMLLMAAAIAIVIGISGYANLEAITRSNIERSANVISERIVDLSANSKNVINSINQHTEIQNLLIMQSTLGPFYHEEGLHGSSIDAADQIYSLQAQLELASLLRPIMLGRNTHSITLYYADSFNKKNPEEAAFSLRLTDDGLEVAQYEDKNKSSMVGSAIIGTDYLSFAGLFDVSSIYELGLDDFLSRMNFETSYALPEAPEADTRGEIDRLIIVDGKPIIQTAAYLNVSIPHPDDWTNTQTSAFIVIIEQQINEAQMVGLKELVNVDIALLVDGQVLVNTLKANDITYKAASQSVYAGEEYFVAARKIAFSAGVNDLRELEILVLSPVSLVINLNLDLFMRVFVVILCSTLLVCILFYWLIARIISSPLAALMQGVGHLAQGELKHKIEIDSEDEMGRLAQAFNQMSADVHEKRDQLRVSHAELEQLLERQGKELESTQMQLIEAEKMSSLGELVAGVSHEVSTPIGICITAESFFRDETKLIQDKFNDGSMSRQDFTEYVKTALDNGEILSANLGRTAELIKNFKQIAVDQCIEDMRSFVVFRYISDLLSTLKPRIKSLKHKIEIQGDEGLEITSLPGALAQIITNLIMNSIIHGFDGIVEGHISIMIVAHERGVIITYKDNGLGMSKQAQEKIFDPFFTTRKGKGGTGLGMNIVYKLITDSLQGKIECTSQLGQGVRFEIFIADQSL
jgi:signal transduction histidine kinase